MTKSSQEEEDSNWDTSSFTNLPGRLLRRDVAVRPGLVGSLLVLLARPTGLGCCEEDGGACLSRLDLRAVGVGGSEAARGHVTGLGSGGRPKTGTGGGSVRARLRS